jgi:hypothetical protein
MIDRVTRFAMMPIEGIGAKLYTIEKDSLYVWSILQFAISIHDKSDSIECTFRISILYPSCELSLGVVDPICLLMYQYVQCEFFPSEIRLYDVVTFS